MPCHLLRRWHWNGSCNDLLFQLVILSCLPPSPPPSPAPEEGFEVAVLMTLGELATVAGAQLRADVPEILPLVIDAIQDGGSPTKRLVAVGTLGQVRPGR